MSQEKAKVAVGDYFRTRDGRHQWTVLEVLSQTVDEALFVRFRAQVDSAHVEQLHSEDWFLNTVERCGGLSCVLDHRYDEQGNHQLVLLSRFTGEVLASGKMVNQWSVACLGNWAAVTPYHSTGEGHAFPAEVFEIHPSNIRRMAR